jgi:hypothetical protein
MRTATIWPRKKILDSVRLRTRRRDGCLPESRMIGKT